MAKKRIRVDKPGTCIVPDCDAQRIRARGLCKRHYQKLYRHGSADDVDHRHFIPPIADGEKWCAGCQEPRPLPEFGERAQSYCKTCEWEYYRTRRLEKTARGECVSCGRKTREGKRQCATCAHRSQQYRGKFENRAKGLLRSAINRADAQGVYFDLDMPWIMERIVGARCELTGLPFDLSAKKYEKGSRYNPFSPSIDRIIAGGDYSKENCRMIVIALNVGINHWGEEIYSKIAKAYLQRQKNSKTDSHEPTMETLDLALEGPDVESVRIRTH